MDIIKHMISKAIKNYAEEDISLLMEILGIISV